MPLDQLWRLAQAWYAGRADEAWSPRPAEAAQQIFADAGLTGAFWQLTSSSRE